MGGKPGGSAPLAITCSGPITCEVVSKYFMFPVSTCTAPMLNRTNPEFSKSKSTSSSSVALRGILGSKKPGTPPTTESAALVSLKILRELLSVPRGQAISRLETRSQNSRKPVCALFGPIAGDDGCVDGADR